MYVLAIEIVYKLLDRVFESLEHRERRSENEM